MREEKFEMPRLRYAQLGFDLMAENRQGDIVNMLTWPTDDWDGREEIVKKLQEEKILPPLGEPMTPEILSTLRFDVTAKITNEGANTYVEILKVTKSEEEEELNFEMLSNYQ